MRALGDLGEAESALPLFAARRFVSLDSAATLERAETGASLLARARRHDAASAGYAALLRRVELPAAVRARFALGLARARRGAGDFAGADSAFILAAVLDSEGPSGEQAAWERAREWEDRKTPLEAATTYAWARPRIRSGSLAAAARIHGALAWLRAGGLDSARALLASPRPESGGLQFWLGQVALAGGDTAASRAAYRAAWRLAPWTYEGIRAAEELKAEGAWPPDSAPFKLELPPRPSPATGGDAPLRARLLEALGLKALGLESFRECARSAGKGGAASCADALEERGQFRAVRPADNGVSGTRWEYPPAYALEVFAAAERESLDPALLWAIMRQESGYNRAVRSRAGALGLLQLLPGTASMLAGRRVPEDSLTVAEVNVRLGARYVRDLMEEMHDPRAVLAAYNAGEDAVRRWLRERGPVNDRWVESIPYRETRDYVKQVYAAWRRYEALYGTLSR
jgi:soluble lytic murein transglycosylase